jgi:hypothetical protein
MQWVDFSFLKQNTIVYPIDLNFLLSASFYFNFEKEGNIVVLTNIIPTIRKNLEQATGGKAIFIFRSILGIVYWNDLIK